MKNKATILAIIYLLISIPVGVFFIVYGEYDDSPGGQLLELIIIIVGIVMAIRSKKKKSDSKTDQT